MKSYRYNRLIALVVLALVGAGWIYMACTWPDAPRVFIVLATVFGVAGVAATLALGLIAWIVITDDVRPRVSLAKPDHPIAISHREASLVGRRRYRNHPIRFWAILTLGNSFVIGFMRCDKPEYVDLNEETHGA